MEQKMYTYPKIRNVLSQAFSMRSDAHALELFSRDGGLQVAAWAPLFAEVIGLDINEEYAKDFSKNIANGTGVCCNSIEEVLNDTLCKRLQRNNFDLVSADHPCGMYGEVGVDGLPRYCDHIDFVHRLPSLVADGGFLLFHINIAPFRPSAAAGSLDSYGMTDSMFNIWMERRKSFYGRHDVEFIPVFTLVDFYEELLSVEREFRLAEWEANPAIALGRDSPNIVYLLFRAM